MKRSALIVCVLLAFVAVTSFADEQETNATDKPLIFIDTNSLLGALIAVNSGFSTFASVARELGYEVDHGKRTEITRESLEGISVYVITPPDYALLDRDKIALREFIQEGGKVILFGWWTESTLDDVARDYDVEFINYEYKSLQATVPASSPLSGPFTCETLESWGRRNLRVLDNSNVITAARYENGQPFLVIPKHKHLKKGKIIITGDLAIFANSSVGGNIEEADNMAFVKNLLVYLKGQYDLVAQVTKYKGKNLTSGDSITAMCRIKNTGSSSSDPTTISFHLTDDGNLSVGPPATVATLKTIKLKSLDPGRSTKLRVKVKLPKWLSQGSYTLVAQVDPDGTSNDSDTSNNTKACKKEIVVN